MIREKLTIQNKLGVHTRAAAKLVSTAKRFASRVELAFNDRLVDGKSIMSVITLGAQKDHVVDFIITGEDEQECLAALTQLVNEKFGED
jgi:phosphocarrier protein HPr